MTYKIPSMAHAAIIGERERQEAKWGGSNHSPEDWMLILMEEVGEFSQAVLNAKFGNDTRENIRKELVQVAAVALAMLECCDRERWDV